VGLFFELANHLRLRIKRPNLNSVSYQQKSSEVLFCHIIATRVIKARTRLRTKSGMHFSG
jgi:hypothetical protein